LSEIELTDDKKVIIMCNNTSCPVYREEHDERLNIEERIRELLGELTRELPIQEFIMIKKEIEYYIDKL